MSKLLFFLSGLISQMPKAGERGGGQNTLGPDWFRVPEVLVEHLVMGATIKRVGGS